MLTGDVMSQHYGRSTVQSTACQRPIKNFEFIFVLYERFCTHEKWLQPYQLLIFLIVAYMTVVDIMGNHG